jgi:hypothetical protein
VWLKFNSQLGNLQTIWFFSAIEMGGPAQEMGGKTREMGGAPRITNFLVLSPVLEGDWCK